MMGPYNFETNVFGNVNLDKNYIKLCTKNYFLKRITQPCKNNLQIFSKNSALLKHLDLLVNKCGALLQS